LIRDAAEAPVLPVMQSVVFIVAWPSRQAVQVGVVGEKSCAVDSENLVKSPW
jgi:hypothetical protein